LGLINKAISKQKVANESACALQKILEVGLLIFAMA